MSIFIITTLFRRTMSLSLVTLMIMLNATCTLCEMSGPVNDTSVLNASELYNSNTSDSSLLQRRLPGVIIIGVKKAGTRALLEYLRLHPLVKGPGPEIHFFDRHYHLGLDWYRNKMPMTTPDQLTIEKTPSYFVKREVPSRVFKMSPETKLLVVVRDPVTRAISDYTQSVTKKFVKKSFVETVFLNGDAETVDIGRSPIRIGFYAKHLKKWLRYFPMEQMLFVSGENLASSPYDEMRRVETFLNLPAAIKSEYFRFNETKGFPCIRKRRSTSNNYRCLGKTKGRTHPFVEQAAIERLRLFYRPFNEQFFTIVNRDFGWNSNLTVASSTSLSRRRR